MVRPIGAFLLLFSLLSLIVHQIGMFEFLGALATAMLAVDLLVARYRNPRPANVVREPLL